MSSRIDQNVRFASVRLHSDELIPFWVNTLWGQRRDSYFTLVCLVCRVKLFYDNAYTCTYCSGLSSSSLCRSASTDPPSTITRKIAPTHPIPCALVRWSCALTNFRLYEDTLVKSTSRLSKIDAMNTRDCTSDNELLHGQGHIWVVGKSEIKRNTHLMWAILTSENYMSHFST